MARWLKRSRKLRKCKKQRTVLQTQLLAGGSPVDLYRVFASFPQIFMSSSASTLAINEEKRLNFEYQLGLRARCGTCNSSSLERKELRVIQTF